MQLEVFGKSYSLKNRKTETPRFSSHKMSPKLLAEIGRKSCYRVAFKPPRHTLSLLFPKAEDVIDYF